LAELSVELFDSDFVFPVESELPPRFSLERDGSLEGPDFEA
jgi:hypothetical protein